MTFEDCLLRVDHASCRINRQSQLRVSHFSVRQGEHWCLFGGNGSGKTLLANLIAGKRLSRVATSHIGKGWSRSRYCAGLL